MTAAVADARASSIADRVAALPPEVVALWSGLTGLDLAADADTPTAGDTADLAGYRRDLLRERVRLPFDQRDNIDATIAIVDAELETCARRASPDAVADLHGVYARALTGPGLGPWMEHAARARGCTRPVRLAGTTTTVDTATGQVLDHLDTSSLPDGVIYKPCGTRRAALCPACAQTYRYDTYHLIAAGLRGGKGVTESVTRHPAVFATFTAPSFGPVHTRIVRKHFCPDRRACGCRAEPCHARRDSPRCEHGAPLSCVVRHRPGDLRIGQPLCLDCYDHDHHVVWNAFVPKLWDRTRITLDRAVHRLGRSLGVRLRARYAKVAEYQARGVVHLHASIRVDAHDPNDPAAVLPPPASVDAEQLAVLIHAAAVSTVLVSPAHSDRPDGWPLTWGHKGVDTRIVHRGVSDARLTESHVAGYLAKYATKTTEASGLLAGRLTTATIDLYTDPDSHLGRLLDACWTLGRPIPADPDGGRPYAGLRRWAHMLGFGGHFSTKSRAYSTTLGAIRRSRQRHASTAPTAGPRAAAPGELHHGGEDSADAETTVVLGDWRYVGSGWLTNADAHLAALAADAARSRQPRLDPHALAA